MALDLEAEMAQATLEPKRFKFEVGQHGGQEMISLDAQDFGG